MTEDDGVGSWEAAAETSQPAPSLPGVMNQRQRPPTELASSVAGSERRSAGSSTLP